LFAVKFVDFEQEATVRLASTGLLKAVGLFKNGGSNKVITIIARIFPCFKIALLFNLCVSSSGSKNMQRDRVPSTVNPRSPQASSAANIENRPLLS
jgi:hypothetical protein